MSLEAWGDENPAYSGPMRECPDCPIQPDKPLDHSVDCSCGHQDCPGVYLKTCDRCGGTGEVPDDFMKGEHHGD